MCGIAGYSRAIGRSSIPDGRVAARDLALAVESRGPHATGFAWVDERAWPRYWKRQGTASRVAPSAPLPHGIKTLLAHTRYFTLGDPKFNANNHPIVAPGLLLTHNGICSNHRDLLKAVNGQPEGIVDSAGVAYLLALGPDELGERRPEKLLGLFRGDAALAWLDTDTPSFLHLARLTGRPLSYASTKRGDLVYASTPQALNAWATMQKITLEDFHTVPEGTYLVVAGGAVIYQAKIDMPKRAVVGSRAKNLTGHLPPHPAEGPEPLPLADVHQLWPSSRGRSRWSTESQSWEPVL